MNKAIGYIRVSTQEQKRSGLGLEAQKRQISEFAQLNGLQLVDVCQDAGISGTKHIEKRPGLQKVLSSMKRGWSVIVADLDRLSRDRALTGLLDYMFSVNKVKLISCNGQGTEIDDSAATLIKGFYSWQSQEYIDNLKKKIKGALNEKRELGEKTGGDVPTGYRISGHVTKKKTISGQVVEYKVPLIERDPEQKAIGTIRRYRKKGISMRAIVDKLNSRNIDGKKWHLTTVYNIIKRENL